MFILLIPGHVSGISHCLELWCNYWNRSPLIHCKYLNHIISIWRLSLSCKKRFFAGSLWYTAELLGGTISCAVVSVSGVPWAPLNLLIVSWSFRKCCFIPAGNVLFILMRDSSEDHMRDFISLYFRSYWRSQREENKTNKNKMSPFSVKIGVSVLTVICLLLASQATEAKVSK